MPRKPVLACGVLGMGLVMGMAAPGWAQSPTVPTRPDDPASRLLGWVEAAPAPDNTSPLAAPRSDADAYAAVMTPTRPHTLPPRRARRNAHPRRDRSSRENHVANDLNRRELV